MIPQSLSASSILVSEACMERWKAENFWRTPQANSEPANIGTAVHFALEAFVKAVHFENKITWDNVKFLNDSYQLGYIETFGTTNLDTDAYRDGAAMVAKWYDRNRDGLPHKVVSCEVKENFPVKTKAGPIPFNFIWDRADQHDEDVYEVVDYKTLRAPVNPDDLKQKIQPRAYALAAQIKWPHAKRIWVTFDMLRYDTVGVVFTKEENADTYRYLQRAANRIIDVPEDHTEETLNAECKWCIKKVSCETLQKANRAGTVHGLSVQQIARRKLEIDSQMQALKYAQEELDKQLVKEAENRDLFEWEEDGLEIKITSRPMRKPNSAAILRLLPPEIAAKHSNITMGELDKILKSGVLDPDVERMVKANIQTNWTSPSAKVKAKIDYEEE